MMVLVYILTLKAKKIVAIVYFLQWPDPIWLGFSMINMCMIDLLIEWTIAHFICDWDTLNAMDLLNIINEPYLWFYIFVRQDTNL